LVASAALAAALLGGVAGAPAGAGPPAGAGAAPAPLGRADGSEAGPAAAALDAALRAGDEEATVALFTADAQIKEGTAVLAAGTARVRPWVETCLLHAFWLDPATLYVADATASWSFVDMTDCYWRTRRRGPLPPALDADPAEGTATIAVHEGGITSLTLVYSPAWQQRALAAQAAPILTAQAQATQRAATQVDAEATASPVPVAPDPQGRGTPSRTGWVAAVTLAVTLAIATAGLEARRAAPW
jgi:hypothetical protein